MPAATDNARFARLALACGLLTLAVVLLSAWLRLRAAGLGCADWPACYAALDALRPAPAWAAYAHRVVASLLGLGLLGLLWYARRRRDARPAVFRATAVAVALMLGLALLGRYTPAPRWPLVTLANLLGGFALLGLLYWIYLRAATVVAPAATRWHPWARGALVVGGAQLALGGWVSANYAAVACPGFPDCGLSAGPDTWRAAFDPLRQLTRDGTALATGAEARLIHAVHRLGAAFVFLYIGTLAVAAVRAGGALRRAGAALAGALLLQLGLGLGAAALGPPLWLATAHNAGAALLLLCTVYLNALLRSEPIHDR